MNGAQRARNGQAAQVTEAMACLDVLAAQMRTRGWTAYIAAPSGRLASLVVQGPHDRADGSDIIVAPGGTRGDLWYWFGWAERIAPVHAPAAAADAIIAALQRPTDREDARLSPAHAP